MRSEKFLEEINYKENRKITKDDWLNFILISISEALKWAFVVCLSYLFMWAVMVSHVKVISTDICPLLK